MEKEDKEPKGGRKKKVRRGSSLAGDGSRGDSVWIREELWGYDSLFVGKHADLSFI